MVTARTVERLSVYDRLVHRLWDDGTRHVYSHELGNLAGVSAAQVRRDLMNIGFTGSPTRGYEVRGLRERIGQFLGCPERQPMVLVGLGHIGQALLAYFSGRGRRLAIVAGFDLDGGKTSRVIHGCRCYPLDMLRSVIGELGEVVGIVAVPAEQAQTMTTELVRCGVRGILNFAPVRLQVPEYVYVEDVDITVLLERVAFYARQGSSVKENAS